MVSPFERAALRGWIVCSLGAIAFIVVALAVTRPLGRAPAARSLEAPAVEQGGASAPLSTRRPLAPTVAAATPTAPPPARRVSVECHPRADGTLACSSCRRDDECPVDHACVPNPDTHKLECQRSSCSGDGDCGDGQVCRIVNDAASAPAIRRCIPIGERGANDSCAQAPLTAETACRAGLVCLYGYCVAPCSTDRPDSCGPGSRCTGTPYGELCRPSCDARSCPAGEQCEQLGGGLAACVRVVDRDADCRERGCPDGEQCLTTSSSASHKLTFQCARTCSPLDASSCGPGAVCGAYGASHVCFRGCTPSGNDCGRGQICAAVSDDWKSFGCRPDTT
jgi:hypothetical protein